MTRYLMFMTGIWTALTITTLFYHHWYQAALQALITLLYVQLYAERRWP